MRGEGRAAERARFEAEPSCLGNSRGERRKEAIIRRARIARRGRARRTDARAHDGELDARDAARFRLAQQLERALRLGERPRAALRFDDAARVRDRHVELLLLVARTVTAGIAIARDLDATAGLSRDLVAAAGRSRDRRRRLVRVGGGRVREAGGARAVDRLGDLARVERVVEAVPSGSR